MGSASDQKIKVAVIGAGAAGLCAARHLSSEPDRFQFSVFEQQDHVGGTWRYTEQIGKDEYGLPVHSSMYANLRTNLPKEVMAFPDFPFPDCGGQSFIHHTVVLKYLEDYASHYGLYEYIKFHTIVDNVQPIDPSTRDPKWLVEVRNIVTLEKTSEIYDAVMVCNGHYSVPHIPDLPGLNSYKGLLLHSHDYRDCSNFKDKTVVILGAGASGIDIALEVCIVARQVILSHNLEPRTCPLPENLTQEVGISSVEEDSVVFANGHCNKCDAIILCTGYLYTYGFLHEDCRVKVGDQRVQPLFKHLFHSYFPTLGIWSVPKLILPFVVYNQQVLLFLKYLKGDVDLPSTSEMLEDEERDLNYRLKCGMKPRHAHLMPCIMHWHYDDQISELGKIPKIPNVVRKLFNHCHTVRKQDVVGYKNFNFRIIDDETFIQVQSK